jgi:NAD(P)-dependent dehydrogenase (short-subunit alcohol dehydrogenase family)
MVYTNKIVFYICILILILLLFLQIKYNILSFFSSSFNSKNVEKDFSRLNNKIIAITGCSSGIGEGVVDILLKQTNSTLILLNRKSKNQEIFLCKMNKELDINKTRIYHIECDLTNFNSVINAYNMIISKFPKGIDVLINNAGITNTLNNQTIDGYNVQIQTNFISHVLLMELIIKYMTNINNQKRLEIINISSMAYKIPNKKYDETMFEQKTDPSIKHDVFLSNVYYQQSKLAILLYTNYLNNFIIKNNKNIKIFCLHPGICKTDLLNKSNLPFLVNYILDIFFSKSIDFPCNFIVDSINNETIMSGDFYGINFITNYIEKIEDSTLINTNCSKQIYLYLQKILSPYLK